LRTVQGFDDALIPPAARPLLVELRRASLAFITSEVDKLVASNNGSLKAVADKQIEETIESEARSAGVELTPKGETQWKMALWSPSVTRSKRNPRYLVIGFYYAVTCGSDAGYLFYDLEAKPTKLLLTVTSPDAETIEPMFWEAIYAVPPPGAPPDNFFVALTRITPWCQSNERMLQLLALKPTDDPAAPEVLVDFSTSQHLLHGRQVEIQGSTIVLITHDGIDGATRRWLVKGHRATALTR
jgi:hypothetical protein